MNTQISRPGHMVPGWGAGLTDQEAADLIFRAYEAESKVCTWLDRIMYGCIGVCLGMMALWAGLLIAAG